MATKPWLALVAGFSVVPFIANAAKGIVAVDTLAMIAATVWFAIVDAHLAVTAGKPCITIARVAIVAVDASAVTCHVAQITY